MPATNPRETYCTNSMKSGDLHLNCAWFHIEKGCEHKKWSTDLLYLNMKEWWWRDTNVLSKIRLSWQVTTSKNVSAVTKLCRKVLASICGELRGKKIQTFHDSVDINLLKWLSKHWSNCGDYLYLFFIICVNKLLMGAIKWGQSERVILLQSKS